MYNFEKWNFYIFYFIFLFVFQYLSYIVSKYLAEIKVKHEFRIIVYSMLHLTLFSAGNLYTIYNKYYIEVLKEKHD